VPPNIELQKYRNLVYLYGLRVKKIFRLVLKIVKKVIFRLLLKPLNNNYLAGLQLGIIVDEYEAKLWSEVHGFTYCEASASAGNGVGDMFHTFFSQIVKQQIELDRAGSLPRTPASARRVQLISGATGPIPGSHKRTSHATSPGPQPAEQSTNQQFPSDEQQAVMTRLGKGQTAWAQLGLENGCSKEEVNKAYRKVAVLLHPDKTGVQGADEAFKLLGMARRIILNTLN
jgi:DnaJ family protein C protein 27